MAKKNTNKKLATKKAENSTVDTTAIADEFVKEIVKGDEVKDETVTVEIQHVEYPKSIEVSINTDFIDVEDKGEEHGTVHYIEPVIEDNNIVVDDVPTKEELIQKTTEIIEENLTSSIVEEIKKDTIKEETKEEEVKKAEKPRKTMRNTFGYDFFGMIYDD